MSPLRSHIFLMSQWSRQVSWNEYQTNEKPVCKTPNEEICLYHLTWQIYSKIFEFTLISNNTCKYVDKK